MKFLYSIFYIPYSKKSGQSLIEVLVGIAVGVIMIIGAITVAVSALKSSADAGRVQASTALAKELLENVRSWAEGDWHNVLSLSTSSANKYYLNTATSPFTTSTGSENIVAGGITYTRSFFIDEAYRDGSGNIVAVPGILDPSTRKITVTVSWPTTNLSPTLTEYLTRNTEKIFIQTDWSGGGGQSGPITVPNSAFSNATNADYTSLPGSLQIQF